MYGEDRRGEDVGEENEIRIDNGIGERGGSGEKGGGRGRGGNREIKLFNVLGLTDEQMKNMGETGENIII